MTRQSLLRRIPKIDELLDRPEVRAIDAPRWAVREAARHEVDALRRAIQSGALDGQVGAQAGRAGSVGAGGAGDGDGAPDDAAARLPVDAAAIARRAAALLAPAVRRVVNATGVVLHTNFGRAPLPPAALARIAALGGGYTNLEYDLDRGERGSRHGHLARLITALTGAEDAVVVNNNAGAVMLCLSALARDREVVVSRGELVEIGGSFRIPEVMELSGARLVEVGTTNKTRAADYAAAITPQTAVLLKVHQSNFAIVGFTEQAPAAEIAALGRDRGVATMMDLGSGALVSAADLARRGLPAEPGVAEVVASGVDVVTFSGDKLLGGPQAGIVAGRAEVIARARRHPLMRALRPDKLTLIALEATLAAYRDGDPERAVPALAMLSELRASIETRAAQVVERLGDAGDAAGVAISTCACTSAVGGGAMPTATLPSCGVSLTPRGGAVTASDIADALRRADVPVIGRIEHDAVILDMRTVQGDRDVADLVAAVAAVVALPARLGASG